MNLRWCSKNSDAFSVAAQQFDITGLPSTSNNLLQILGKRYNLPKLADLLDS